MTMTSRKIFTVGDHVSMGYGNDNDGQITRYGVVTDITDQIVMIRWNGVLPGYESGWNPVYLKTL